MRLLEIFFLSSTLLQSQIWLQFGSFGRLDYWELAGRGSIVAAAVCEVCRQGCCGSHMTCSLHTAAFEAPELFTPVWAGRLESRRIERLRERGMGAGSKGCGIAEQGEGIDWDRRRRGERWRGCHLGLSCSSSFCPPTALLSHPPCVFPP